MNIGEKRGHIIPREQIDQSKTYRTKLIVT